MKKHRLWRPGSTSRHGVAPGRRISLWFLLACSSVGAAVMRAPQATTPVPQVRSTSPALGDNRGETKDPFAEQTASKMMHLREDERRKRLLADTAKLVALSSELQGEVEKSSRDELSLEVIRKATEIEKLAHDVRERMKN